MRRLLIAALSALGLHAVFLGARVPDFFRLEPPTPPSRPPLSITLEHRTVTDPPSEAAEETLEKVPEPLPEEEASPDPRPREKPKEQQPDQAREAPVPDEPEEDQPEEAEEPAPLEEIDEEAAREEEPSPEEPEQEYASRRDEPAQKDGAAGESKRVNGTPASPVMRDLEDPPSMSVPREQPSDHKPEPEIQEAIPLYKENPPPEYPRLARLRGYEGTVMLDVLVTREGEAEQVNVIESSGYGILDEAAKEAVKEWRFHPGRRAGRAVDMRVAIPVTFRFRD